MDDRGAALPLALLILTIMLTLTAALSALSTSEPAIATNHLLSAQARAAAEAGLSTVLAAHSNPLVADTRFPPTIAAAVFTAIPGTTVGYRAALIEPAWAGATPYERANQLVVTVVGYAKPGGVPGPADVAPGRALKTVQAVIRRNSLLNTFLAPAALTAPAGGTIRGDVDARLDAAWSPHGAAAPNWCLRGDTSAPLAPRTGAGADGSHSISQTGGRIWGPGNVENENGSDILHQSSSPSPSDFLYANQRFRPGELAALRALATSTGTWYSGNPVIFGGAGMPLPANNTVLFVEGSIQIEVTDATWTGWIVAVPATPGSYGTGGQVAFTCAGACSGGGQSMTINGLVYAEDTFAVDTSAGDRQLTINGAVITRQGSGAPNVLNPRDANDLRINLRCQGDTHRGGQLRGVRDALVNTGNTLGTLDLSGPNAQFGWTLKPGGYRELSGAQ